MHFQVLVNGRPRRVELGFGSTRDLRILSHWRVPTRALEPAAVRDTIEFARLASKRHRHYLRSIATATGLNEFQAIVRASAESEIAFLLVARADWFPRSSILGLAQCRRTFCHHVVLEFLSVHPAIVGGLEPRVSNVGAGLVCGLAEIAGHLGIKLIWGEATAYSASFYSHIAGLPGLKDHFFIHGESFERCRQKFRTKVYGRLD